jgi:citrate lyase subunit beta/citryl-CoA lyase
VAALAAVCDAGPDAVVAPKVGSAQVLRAYDGALCAAPERVRLWAMIETSSALLNLREIAGAGGRLQALLFGGNDMSKDLRRAVSANRTALHPGMAWTVAAARANGLIPVDAVFNVIEDPSGLEAECREGRDFGFDGKSLIHPSQIETCNRVFSPSDAEIAWARAVVSAFADPANAGKGVVRAGGQMAERLHLEQAERVLALAGA